MGWSRGVLVLHIMKGHEAEPHGLALQSVVPARKEAKSLSG
jgi:hypothetical protein